MWNVVLIALAALAVGGSLVLGWPILVAILIFLALVGAWAATGAVQRAGRKPDAPGADAPAGISEVRDPSEAGPSETPHATR
jgi:membrane protein implicated in regulation of membrane protease activity